MIENLLKWQPKPKRHKRKHETTSQNSKGSVRDDIYIYMWVYNMIMWSQISSMNFL